MALVAKVVRGGCPHDCPDSCAWEVTVDDGRAVKLRGATDHPVTRGGLCAKVNRYLDRVYHPDRLLRPLRRAGPKGSGAFQEVSWEAALDEISRRFHEILASDGGEAILPYDYAGNQGVIQWQSLSRRFFARLGASRLRRTICASTAGAGVSATLGTTTGILPGDVVHSRFIVLWGTNTVVTNLHLWPVVRRAREAGATVVVVDPVRTRTAESADWFVQPLPGTDAALALAMMHVIVRDGLHDTDYLRRHCLGFDRLVGRLQEYPPERAAGITGVEADEIVRLARAYATTRPALIRTLVGAEKHANGGMNLRTIACLPAVVGAWRERGGGLLHTTSGLHGEALDLGSLVGPEPEPRTRAINMIQLGRALTSEELRPPVRALFVYNANPAATAANQNLVLEGLRREDLFTVVHDLTLTDTARHADLVLPAASFLEQLDLIKPWGHEYLVLNQPAIAPPGEAVSNTELFRRLARAMAFSEPYLYASDEELVRALLASDHPHLEGITFEGLSERGWARLNLPDPWLPFAEGGFPTASGKCELSSGRMAALGFDPLPAHVPTPDPGGRLTLVSAKFGVHFLNSSYGNLSWHAAAEGAPVVDISPEDAAARGIGDGDPVRVFNERGAVEARARVGDRVRPGVVAMAHGRWRSLGASANALTPDGITDLGGGGDFYDARVEVAPAVGPDGRRSAAESGAAQPEASSPWRSSRPSWISCSRSSGSSAMP
jgi:anaerobic selenocysteine-containing dehydrogenase